MGLRSAHLTDIALLISHIRMENFSYTHKISGRHKGQSPDLDRSLQTSESIVTSPAHLMRRCSMAGVGERGKVGTRLLCGCDWVLGL